MSLLLTLLSYCPIWLHKEKRLGGVSSRNNIGHFSSPLLLRFKKVWRQRNKAFASYSFFPFPSFAVTMCPISSSPFLSAFNFHALQVTGVSCNMLCFPTWVLMRQMNIHEEEADIAVWRLCCGWLCAWGLLWPHFWGICCAVGRHQGTLGSFSNDADAWVLFWSVVVDDLFPRPFLSPSWLLELKFSLQLLVEDSQGVKDWGKRAAFLLPTLLLLFLPVVLTCDKGMPWVASPGTISVFLFYLSLFVATFLFLCVVVFFFFFTFSFCDD